VTNEAATSYPYLAYLLRMWRVETEEGPVWRVVLEDPHSIERRCFADLPALYRFLNEKTQSAMDLKTSESEQAET